MKDTNREMQESLHCSLGSFPVGIEEETEKKERFSLIFIFLI